MHIYKTVAVATKSKPGFELLLTSVSKSNSKWKKGRAIMYTDFMYPDLKNLRA